MSRLVIAQGLSLREQEAIRQLEASCSVAESLTLKLNWEMLEQRSPDEKNDFLAYDGETLVGFLGLYALGGQIEVTGMVHPNYRRSGIFRRLFDAAMRECENRGVRRVLFITERVSRAGDAFAKNAGWPYVFSEYRMKLETPAALNRPKHGISLRQAEPGDSAELVHLDAIGFGAAEVPEESGETPRVYDWMYLAELEGQVLGKIGVMPEGENSYIFGFVIKPEFRGRGYGREMLQLTIARLSAAGKLPVILEVAVENEKALHLYQSCGFKTVTVYDYYRVNVNLS